MRASESLPSIFRQKEQQEFSNQEKMFKYPVNPALLDYRSKSLRNLNFVNEFV